MPSETELAALLAAELRAAFIQLKRKWREHGGLGEWTPSQISVVLRLQKEGSAAVSSLARSEGMRPQSMSAIIATLLEAGLVSASPDPRDRRQTLMSLTDKCRQLIQEVSEASQGWLVTSIQERLSVPEQETLSAAVELWARLVED